MITGLIDHGLHMIKSREFNYHSPRTWLVKLHSFILKYYMPQPHLPCHHYELFFILLHCHYSFISLIPIWPSISTSFFENRSFIHCMWAKQVVCFDCQLTKTICRPMFFQFGGNGARAIFLYSTKKNHWKKLQVKW